MEEEEGAVVNLNGFNGACPSKEKATVSDDEDVTAAAAAAAAAAVAAVLFMSTFPPRYSIS